MSEIGAIRNAFRMERQAAKVEKATVNVTATGKVVDISKGFKVKGPDGLTIPFRPETPLSKAREWVKNFYTPESRFTVTPKARVTSEREDSQSFNLEVYPEKENASKSPVGHISFVKDYKKKEFQIKMSRIWDSEKGKGVGAGMYRHLFDLAKKEGFRVRSDSGMSDASIAIWRRFKELGYPVIEHPHGKVPGRNFKMRTDKRPSEDAPIFELDTSKPFPGDPKESIKIDPLDREVRDALRGKTGIQELREKITEAYLNYKNAVEPEERKAFADEVRSLLPPKEKT